MSVLTALHRGEEASLPKNLELRTGLEPPARLDRHFRRSSPVTRWSLLGEKGCQACVPPPPPQLLNHKATCVRSIWLCTHTNLLLAKHLQLYLLSQLQQRGGIAQPEVKAAPPALHRIPCSQGPELHSSWAGMDLPDPAWQGRGAAQSQADNPGATGLWPAATLVLGWRRVPGLDIRAVFLACFIAVPLPSALFKVSLCLKKLWHPQVPALYYSTRGRDSGRSSSPESAPQCRAQLTGSCAACWAPASKSRFCGEKAKEAFKSAAGSRKKKSFMWPRLN